MPIPILAILGLFIFIQFLTSPVSGDFSWSDAPRHALDGVFFRDVIHDLPSSLSKQYAINYYLQYPALTILFYPPLMSLIMAGFYALFGVSHGVAQASIAVFQFGLSVGVYLLARRWLPTWQAFAASLLLAGAPEISFWARQVMLDIPAYAWLVFSIVFFLRYLDDAKPKFLYLTAIFLLCALYTKQTVIFAFVVFVFVLLATQGIATLRQRHVWLTALLFIVSLLPLVYVTLEFGQVNIASVAGARKLDLERSTVGAWLYYLKQMPEQLSWTTFLLALGFILGTTVRRDWRLPKADSLLLLSWLVIGYLFFSAISVREPRHDLTILWPLVIFAVLFLNRMFARLGQHYATWAALLIALGTCSYSVIFKPVPYVRGYAEAAQFIIEHAPKHSVVLFSGNRDGSFVFNVRADDRRHDLSVLRADKILLRIAIERSRGYEDRGLTENTIYDLLNHYGVHYVVAQTDFWTDIPSMQALQNLLMDKSRFQSVQRISTKSNYNIPDRELVIYRNLGEVADKPMPISLEMVGIGRTISGKMGNGQ